MSRDDDRHVHALRERGHRRPGIVGAGDQVAGDRQEPSPGRPEPQRPPVAEEEREPELGLERPQLPRDGRLGDPDVLGGGRHRAVVDDRQEVAQDAKFHASKA